MDKPQLQVRLPKPLEPYGTKLVLVLADGTERDLSEHLLVRQVRVEHKAGDLPTCKVELLTPTGECFAVQLPDGVDDAGEVARMLKALDPEARKRTRSAVWALREQLKQAKVQQQHHVAFSVENMEDLVDALACFGE